MNRLRQLSVLGVAVAAASITTNAWSKVWTTYVPDAGVTIRFDDWGFTGPGGRNAQQFEAINGFGRVTQRQKVVTRAPDRLTPDSPQSIYQDLYQNPSVAGTVPKFPDANMDSQTNFYGWGYTSPAGSTFSNMRIDSDGDYLISRNDMQFGFYDTFSYQNEGASTTTADGDYPTNISFQPYALSDAIGWCGSVLTSNPLSNEPMAGQVTFDFGFEAFFPGSAQTPGTGALQIVKDFEMRSYGTLEVQTSVADGGVADLLFTANAVVNNTDPTATPTGNFADLQAAGPLGANPYYNVVSFMGGGVVPTSVWVLVKPGSESGSAVKDVNNILAVLDVDANGNPIIPIDPDTGQAMVGDLIQHTNAFAKYPFLLRADADRMVEGLDFSLYSDLSNVPASALVGVQDLSPVPVPAAVWLFGSGLLGLLAAGRRRARGQALEG